MLEIFYCRTLQLTICLWSFNEILHFKQENEWWFQLPWGKIVSIQEAWISQLFFLSRWSPLVWTQQSKGGHLLSISMNLQFQSFFLWSLQLSTSSSRYLNYLCILILSIQLLGWDFQEFIEWMVLDRESFWMMVLS